MIRVGIIEDMPDYRNVLEVLINHTQGMTVAFSAGSAEEAMPLFTSTQPSICIVDINLPGQPGHQVVRWIRQQ
ncbi:MAG: response regulator, partial [Chitinophagaceae bacterium]|nr:response regulator [Chitinophagaceae bacterium]